MPPLFSYNIRHTQLLEAVMLFRKGAVNMVALWVKELVESAGPPYFQVGDTVKHSSGRSVKITGGRFWGTHGVSNFWYWREVMPDGSLGPEESGYGWNPAEVV